MTERRKREPRLEVTDDGRLVRKIGKPDKEDKGSDNEEDDLLIQDPKSGLTTDRSGDVKFRAWVIFWITLQPVIGIFGAMPVMLPRHGYGHFDLDPGEICHYVIAVWLGVQFAYNLVMLYAADPGRLTRKFKPALEAQGQYEVNLPEKVLEEHGLVGQKLYYAPRWCYKCKLWQPPRTKHCDICRYCVIRMDHHSILTNRCVGLRNHGYWALYNLFAVMGGVYSLYLAVHCLYISWDDRLVRKELERHVWYLGEFSFLLKTVGYACFYWNDVGHATCIFIVVAFVCGFYSGWMGTTNLIDTFNGVTRMEKELEYQEYVDLKGGQVAPIHTGFYRQKDPWENFLSMLGPNWGSRIWFPVPGEPHPEEGFFPRLNPTALTQVVKRLKKMDRDATREDNVL